MTAIFMMIKYTFLFIGNLIPGFQAFAPLKVVFYRLSGMKISHDVQIVGPMQTDYSMTYDTLGSISIGRETYIARDFRVSTYKSRVSIGERCQIASNVSLETNTHEIYERDGIHRKRIQKPITIHNDVWIGANALILPGVTIGENAIVAGGAVVTKDVPAHVLVGGSPARIIREL